MQPLFRWKTPTWEWVYWDLVHDAFDWTSRIIPVWIQKPWYYPVEVLPESVWQWTGLVDKNGIKIFAWDIIKNPKAEWVVIWESPWLTIKWHKDNYKNHSINLILCKWSASKTLQIIWNVTDNPDLLSK